MGWDVVGQLFKLSVPVEFSLGDADACGANVGMAKLVVLVSGGMLVELEFEIDCIGLAKIFVAVSLVQSGGGRGIVATVGRCVLQMGRRRGMSSVSAHM